MRKKNIIRKKGEGESSGWSTQGHRDRPGIRIFTIGHGKLYPFFEKFTL